MGGYPPPPKADVFFLKTNGKKISGKRGYSPPIADGKKLAESVRGGNPTR